MFAGHVHAEIDRTSASGLDFADDRRAVQQIGNGHNRALARDSPGESRAYAARSAGDDDDFVLKP